MDFRFGRRVRWVRIRSLYFGDVDDDGDADISQFSLGNQDTDIPGAHPVEFDDALHVWNQFRLNCSHDYADTDALSGEPAFRLATEVNEVGEFLALREFAGDPIQSSG